MIDALTIGAAACALAVLGLAIYIGWRIGAERAIGDGSKSQPDSTDPQTIGPDRDTQT